MKSKGAVWFIVVGVAALAYIAVSLETAGPLEVLSPFGYVILGLGGVAIIIGMIKLGFGENGSDTEAPVISTVPADATVEGPGNVSTRAFPVEDADEDVNAGWPAGCAVGCLTFVVVPFLWIWLIGKL